MRPTRRRFLTILAAGATTPAFALSDWRGQAMGAATRILIDHPNAEALVSEARAEIARLERVFSLYTDSALSRLNRDGRLDAPPFELLDCLALCDAVHGATGGRFDPTVQPLWALYAQTSGRPGAVEREAALARTGWHRVTYDEAAVRLDPGMELTLNGVAQGHVADRVAALLRAEGLTHVLIDAGEIAALGPMADGTGWPVTLPEGRIALSQGGLATSAALGTTFDAAGKVGHILDPRTGLAAPARWRAVSVTAPGAGLADALSTAACLMPDRATIEAALAHFPGTTLAALV